MNSCPCCSSSLLCHVRHKGVYWFCPQCRAEMPVLELTDIRHLQKKQRRNTLQSILHEPIRVVANYSASTIS